MIEIVNLENAKVSNRTYGEDTDIFPKEGIIYNGEHYLVKYPSDSQSLITGEQRHFTIQLNEYLGSQIYNILGVSVQETILGIRRGQLVCACKDFTEHNQLVKVGTLIREKDEELKELLEERVHTKKIEIDQALERYFINFEYNHYFKEIEGLIDRFWEIQLLDILINNNDRHFMNWGVLKDSEGRMTLAPLFDNGMCLYTNIREDIIIELLSDTQQLYSSALEGVTIYLAVKFTENYLSNITLQKAILKLVPLFEERMQKIYDFIDSLPEYYRLEDNTTIEVCTKNRKEIYKKILQIRLDIILKPMYEKVLELQ